MNKQAVFSVVVLSLFLSSCASFKTQYASEAKQWNNDQPSDTLELEHTMYLIGDAGNAAADAVPVLDYLKPQLAEAGTNSSVVFLGDNIYEYGMPPKEDTKAREEAEISITAQLKVLDEFDGRPVFIPGNHDWRGWGLKGLKEQEKFVENYLNSLKGKEDKNDWENYFLPDDGCSGPEAVELSDDVVMLVVDSHWWLTDWDKHPKINEGCEARNRATFGFIFENEVRKYRNKNLIIAMHHPLYTYGPHGGGYTWKQHIFPLTDVKKYLYLPLPGIGSLGVFIRSVFGSRQDTPNRTYREMRKAILAAAKKNGNFIFVAGHEHTLQYIENESQTMIVSGSGSKKSQVRLGKGSLFATGRVGYSTLQFYKGGETWAQFFEVAKDGKSAKLVFQKKVKHAKASVANKVSYDFTEYERHNDSSTQTITTKKVQPVSGAHEFIFGRHHRDIYLEKYTFPALDLNAFEGGVTPVKLGGGNQTNSLRVRNAQGRDFVLRGMNKDASRFLPFPFNKMLAAQYIVEDFFLSTHPFAPLAIPPLANAINVYHTNPKIYYVPQQPRLGEYNGLFGGALALVEERPNGKKWDDAPFFGAPDDIVGTPDLLEDLMKNNNHKVDQQWALRSRLLDVLIGDWDRHDDQWVWAKFQKEDKLKIYRPIPRDRDQAFSRYDGLLTKLANQTMPFLRQLQSYGPEIAHVKWNTWSARLFDRTFLNELDWTQWEKEVKWVQQHLTDSTIDYAFQEWPTRAREISAPFIITAIKSRRDNLLTLARAHYLFISQSVNVVGTEERERFLIEHLPDDKTRVTVFEISKKGDNKGQVYQRVFSADITHAINVYGNGDDDEFIVRGQTERSSKVRLIGGVGKDVFADSSFVTKGGRKTWIYDDLGKNTVISGRETKDKRTSLYRYNIYDRRGYDSEYDIMLPLPILGYNPDDGALIGAQLHFINYAFKKEPYGSAHTVNANYAFATNAFKVGYRGDYLNAFRNFDFLLDVRYHGPTFAFNFAGLGNDTQRPVDDANFYRVRQESIQIRPWIKKRFASNSGAITFGPSFQTYEVEETPGRFVAQYGAAEDPELFERKNFGAMHFGVSYDNVDNFFNPHKGVKFQSGYSLNYNLDNENQFSMWQAQLSFYISLDARENFIFASEVGGAQVLGNGFEFFQRPTLGGFHSLRGYRTERFYGRSSFWQTSDLRVRLTSNYNPVLPLTLGLFGSFDYGRVWLQREESDTWHNSVGGGVWIAPVDALILSVGTFFPKEDFEESPRFVFRLGFGF